MKKTVFLMACLLAAGAAAFATGNRQTSQPDAASGLTVIRAWGNDKSMEINNVTYHISDFFTGRARSRFFDRYVELWADKGIKLEFTGILQDQLETAFQTLVASNRLNEYDWIAPNYLTNKAKIQLINQNRLYPLDQAIQQYSQGRAKEFFFNDPRGRAYAALETTEDGHFYWISQTEWNPLYASTYSALIRQDWLDKLGLPMPKTLDEYYNTLAAFQERDVNGSGIKDEIHAIVQNGFGHGIPEWFGIPSELIQVDGTTGKIATPWYSKYIKEYFTYMNRLYRAGFLKITDDTDAVTYSNQCATTYSYIDEYWIEPKIVLPPGAPPAYYNNLLIQAYPDQPAYLSMYGKNAFVDWGGSMHAIPAGSKNVAVAARLIDLQYDPAFQELYASQGGIPGYNFEYNVNNKTSVWPQGTPWAGKDGVDNNWYSTHTWPGAYGVDATDSVHKFSGLTGWRALFPDDKVYSSDINELIAKFRSDQVRYERPITEGGLNIKNFREDFVINQFYAGKLSHFFHGSEALAWPTLDEVEKEAAILADLETACDELAISLIMGTRSVNDWDAHIANLERLGLKELVAVNQSRLDRALKR
jgi:ABC-type glycerol-3-phosphate transport system substrate-binding protein